MCNTDLTSANYDFAYDKTHNVRPRRNIRAAMAKEISMYAIAQKDVSRARLQSNPHTTRDSQTTSEADTCDCFAQKMGLDKAVEDCKYAMKRYGVTPNILVIPPQLSLYMALAPEEKLT